MSAGLEKEQCRASSMQVENRKHQGETSFPPENQLIQWHFKWLCYGVSKHIMLLWKRRWYSKNLNKITFTKKGSLNQFMNWDWGQLQCNWNKDEVRCLLSAHIGFNGIRKLFHVEPAFDGWAWMSPARGHPSKREKGKVMVTVNLAHIWKVKQGCILGATKWISIFFLPTFQLHWP